MPRSSPGGAKRRIAWKGGVLGESRPKPKKGHSSGKGSGAVGRGSNLVVEMYHHMVAENRGEAILVNQKSPQAEPDAVVVSATLEGAPRP